MRGRASKAAGVVRFLAVALLGCNHSGTIVPPPGAVDDATVPPFADVGVNPEASGPVADGALDGGTPVDAGPAEDAAPEED